MIELNADIGEGCDDGALMPYLSRVSIACGGHTGDAVSMTAALRLAVEHGVAVGAHPSYPDRIGFGRRALAASAKILRLGLRSRRKRWPNRPHGWACGWCM